MFCYTILLALPALITAIALSTDTFTEQDLNFIFNMLDTNYDGTLARTEADKFYIKEYDINNNGKITREEFFQKSKSNLAVLEQLLRDIPMERCVRRKRYNIYN
uniref:EF-hand domain-containing protein n=1 Tax=Arion vulgaris TaxID=1028688 RepID=A0A0B6ZR28_9EUPU